jgi:hypothetical protein
MNGYNDPITCAAVKMVLEWEDEAGGKKFFDNGTSVRLTSDDGDGRQRLGDDQGGLALSRTQQLKAPDKLGT